MATIILVAHGNARPGSFSDPKVKIITKSGEPLSFQEARNYLEGNPAPEYPSSSLGDFGGLSDADCHNLFDLIPNATEGYVNTGKRRGGDINGLQIFALRGARVSFVDIQEFAHKYDKVILLACRVLQ